MNEEEDYYVYIVRCSDGSLYTGSTNNLPARVEKHNRGEGARYTRGRRPVTLVYSESAASKSDALKREIQIKKMTRADKLSLIKEQS
ncbi:MAG: GIY-YIG nuclease family protein [Syntrophomonadaceae bacterium]|nr:GIY-YIG nuclease family protein [Syntrophomonadaceae bacterium]